MASPALTHEQYQRLTRMPALDGIRAVAVLLVITWHVRSGALGALNGDFGVQVFFVLSGFLICSLALREEDRSGRFYYASFMLRRAFRILPLLWLGLLAYALAVFVLKLDDRSDAFLHALPYYFLYLPEVPVFRLPASGPGDGAIPFSGIWSIGIEEKFYLIWPILIFWMLRKGKGLRPWLCLGLTVFLWALHAFGPPEASRYLRYYAPILLGSALALALANATSYKRCLAVSHPAFALMALLGLGLLNVQRQGPLGLALQQLLVAVLIVALVCRPGSVGAGVLSLRPVRYLGAISYPLYLFHSLALKAADKFLPAGSNLGLALASLALALLVALPACAGLHRYFEVPLQNVGRRLAARFGPEGQSWASPAAASDDHRGEDGRKPKEMPLGHQIAG